MMYITLPITNPEKYDEPIEDNNKWIMCNICNSCLLYTSDAADD